MIASPPKVSREGFTALQREPYGIATGLPLQCNSAPAIVSGGPYGKKMTAFPVKNRCQKPSSSSVLEKPGEPYGITIADFRCRKH